MELSHEQFGHPKPLIYQLPWPRLNCLLAGLPGFSIEASMRGGIADGETMAIVGETRSFRTTVCTWLAAHFIEKYAKKVTVFTSEEEEVRSSVALARLGVPRSAKERPANTTYWAENGHELDVYPLADIEEDFKQAHGSTGVIIVDTPIAHDSAGEMAHVLQHTALIRNVPVFFTHQFSRTPRHDVLLQLPEMVVNTTTHILQLDPTLSRRHLVMTLPRSRTGVCGALLLDTSTLTEIL